jgi:hypothetical protein
MMMGLLLAGCAEMGKPQGGTGEGEWNVLSAGPIRGTTLDDVPQAVKDTLQERAPHERIADIDKTKRDGRRAYSIRFYGVHKKMYIMEDGQLWEPPE